MIPYLVYFVQFHEDFRLPELEALAKLENVNIKLNREEYSNENPFFVVELESDEDAKRLIRRSILIKYIIQLWTTGNDYPEVYKNLKSFDSEKYKPYETSTFKFMVETFNGTRTMKEQVDIINTFSFLPFKGSIDLKKPDNTFMVLEKYPAPTEPPCKIYMGKLVGSGDRQLVATYDLKKRKYLGTTSMDAELSLIMSNMALVHQNSLVLDPFVGTGSFLITCSHYGAFTLGSDIDGRQIRGKGKTSIATNIEQYNMKKKVLGTIVSDMAHHPWRNNGELFDAIVTDPPYGVRAGAKKIGLNTDKYDAPPPTKRDVMNPRYPLTVPYEMEQVLIDLIEFASKYLVVGGRLVYWLPTNSEEYNKNDIPQHPSLKLIANSEQSFGKWSRRLITMEKIKKYEDIRLQGEGNTGHYQFRHFYFYGKDGEQTTEKENKKDISKDELENEPKKKSKHE